MFRRREEEEETMETIIVTETATAVAPVEQPAAPAPVAVTAVPVAPTFRPVAQQPAVSARVSTVSQPISADRALHTLTSRNTATNKRVLSVGPDIQMKGEIASCDRLVIEGLVDAVIRDVHTVELTETGALKGTAEVNDAEISGAFEGDLVVRGKLTIHATGRVRGNVTYDEIEIQRGGQISGNIRTVADVKMQPVNQNMNLQKAKAA